MQDAWAERWFLPPQEVAKSVTTLWITKHFNALTEHISCGTLQLDTSAMIQYASIWHVFRKEQLP